MKTNLTARYALVALVFALVPLVARAQSYPITLAATAEVSGQDGALTGTLTIYIHQMMRDADFKQVTDALKYGGYLQLIPALRRVVPVGYVKVGNRQTELKYARERRDGKPGLVLATDRPILFVGGGALDAKPRAGYEMGVIELELDGAGVGQGTMAAAARVKLGPDGGVVVDDYAVNPIHLSVKPGH
jgi:hypothetical protein